MGFKERYLVLKNQGFTDQEIATAFHCSKDYLRKCKRLYDIPPMRRPRKNNQGVSEEELQKGESLGLTRRIMLQRVRFHEWPKEKAIREPLMGNREKQRRKNT